MRLYFSPYLQVLRNMYSYDIWRSYRLSHILSANEKLKIETAYSEKNVGTSSNHTYQRYTTFYGFVHKFLKTRIDIDCFCEQSTVTKRRKSLPLVAELHVRLFRKWCRPVTMKKTCLYASNFLRNSTVSASLHEAESTPFWNGGYFEKVISVLWQFVILILEKYL